MLLCFWSDTIRCHYDIFNKGIWITNISYFRVKNMKINIFFTWFRFLSFVLNIPMFNIFTTNYSLLEVLMWYYVIQSPRAPKVPLRISESRIFRISVWKIKKNVFLIFHLDSSVPLRIWRCLLLLCINYTHWKHIDI